MIRRTRVVLGAAGVLASSALVGWVGCKNDATALCPSRPPPACILSEAGAAVTFTPCIQDECSLATLRAILTAEMDAAALGQTGAVDPVVAAAAAQMTADFQADESALAALEAQLAIAESSCAESQRVAADLAADLAQARAATGAAFDPAFVASQVAALVEVKQVVNFDLIGCAANGNLKTYLRFIRLRTLDGGTTLTAFDGGAALGVVPDLAALQTLFDGGAPASPDAGADGGGDAATD